MTLIDRLKVNEDGLTSNERRVSAVLLRDPHDVQFMSAAEVASQASVHESSVIRLAQKLGYKGYTALRQDLREEARRVDVSTRSKLREQKSHELARYVQDEANALLRLSEVVPQEQIDEISRILIGARKVFLYGSSLLVDCMEKRLRRVGIDSVQLPALGLVLPELAASMTGDDVLFSFVMREPYAPMQTLSRHAHAQGAATITICDEPGVQFNPKPDHLVTALRGADDNFRTIITPIALCYAFELSIYHQSKDAASASLAKINELNELFGLPGNSRPGTLPR